MIGLDFILIGVQKGGTTSLWQYLRDHPSIAMPAFKEAGALALNAGKVQEALTTVMSSAFGETSTSTMSSTSAMKLGKGATHYMMGTAAADVDLIAERIAETFPDVRLIALLRDPIERCVSHYRMSVRRGYEARSLDEAVEELLEPEGLEAGRRRASETNSYLVQGEYGRILGSYRARFPAERIHIEMTADLARAPGAVIDRVLAFLGLPPGYRPESLGRHHVGGIRPRLDSDAEAELRTFMEREVWPALDERVATRTKLAFSSFLDVWNVEPDDRRPSLSPANRKRLEEHYRADSARLAKLGIDAPWLGSWTQRGWEDPAGG